MVDEDDEAWSCSEEWQVARGAERCCLEAAAAAMSRGRRSPVGSTLGSIRGKLGQTLAAPLLFRAEPLWPMG